jgi:hypothetical protein
MRTVIAALMSFAVAAILPDPAPAQTSGPKGADAGKQADKHKKARKAQLHVPAPASATAAPVVPYEERSGPKMGM